MKSKLFFLLSLLMVSVLVMAEPKPLRVLVLGDDPMMVSDPASGSVGYATMLQPLFDAAVTVDVQASAALLPSDPAALLQPAKKGDIVLLCKLPVEMEVEGKLQSDVYLDQLLPIIPLAKKKGVKLVWLTPACVRYFTADSIQVHRQGIYPDVVRRLCKRVAQQLIDLEQLTFDWLTEAGLDSTAAFFVPVQPATPVAAHKVAREGVLLNEAGAQKVAQLIGDAIRADKKNVLFKRLRIEEQSSNEKK